MRRYIGIKITEREALFLEKIALKCNLTKVDNTPSTGKALQHILQDALHSIEHDDSKKLDDIQRMVEQINASIPHISSASFVAAQGVLSTMDEGPANKIKTNAIRYINETVGQIQSNKYEHINIAYNHRNIITMPINEESSQWK